MASSLFNYRNAAVSPEQKKNNIFSPMKAYPAAIEQQGGDYDEIMNRYRTMGDTPSVGPTLQKSGTFSFNQINPSFQNFTALNSPERQTFNPLSGPKDQVYSQSADTTSSLANLKQLSETGGYSAGDISNLRARAVSPIRSVYANANRGLERQRALGGGYSANYGASTSKMAREQSELASSALTNTNAGIAESVAEGKRLSAPQYAQLVANEARAKESIDSSNISSRNRTNELNASQLERINSSNSSDINRINELNAARSAEVNAANASSRSRSDEINAARQLEVQGRNQEIETSNADAVNRFNEMNATRQMQATQGMQSLYGTTPALASMYGNQALQTEQLSRQPIPRRRDTRGGMIRQAPRLG